MRAVRMVELAVAVAACVIAWGCGGGTTQPPVTGRPATFPAFALADSNRNTVTYGRTVTRDSLLSATFAHEANPGTHAPQASVVYFGWST